MSAYYNEFNKDKANYLRKLIANNLIAAGDVDERSILEVTHEDLLGYTQCHFFAGIGGWSLAMRYAGWPDNRPVWTGSCPCQSFSTAGGKNGRKDKRHLWPEWFRLIKESTPATIFGEQVAAAITYGWLDEVFSDLESSDYACASAIIRACSVSKGHERRRLWFVAHAEDFNDCRDTRKVQSQDECGSSEKQKEWTAEFSGSSVARVSSGCFREGIDGLKYEIEPSIPLLAYGVSNRMDIFAAKSFGDAIVPQVAAQFVGSFMDLDAP